VGASGDVFGVERAERAGTDEAQTNHVEGSHSSSPWDGGVSGWIHNPIDLSDWPGKVGC
jgi:hypothetical protein